MRLGAPARALATRRPSGPPDAILRVPLRESFICNYGFTAPEAVNDSVLLKVLYINAFFFLSTPSF